MLSIGVRRSASPVFPLQPVLQPARGRAAKRASASVQARAVWATPGRAVWAVRLLRKQQQPKPPGRRLPKPPGPPPAIHGRAAAYCLHNPSRFCLLAYGKNGASRDLPPLMGGGPLQVAAQHAGLPPIASAKQPPPAGPRAVAQKRRRLQRFARRTPRAPGIVPAQVCGEELAPPSSSITRYASMLHQAVTPAALRGGTRRAGRCHVAHCVELFSSLFKWRL